MFKNRLGAGCILLLMLSSATITFAQEGGDPFGRYDAGGEKGVAQAADPSPGADGAPAGEKSVLAGADQGVAAADHQDLCRCIGASDSEATARIEKKLRAPLASNGLDFSETPLEEVINLLQEEYDIPIQLDELALEETGLDSSEPVTVNLNNISLRSALRLMLKKLDLTYVIQDEVLKVTTPERAESQLVTCVYDVRKLVEKQPMPAGASAWADFDPLVSAIQSCIAVETWKENGTGEADIRSLHPGLLVISQTPGVHGEIRELLEAIRDMRGKPAAEADAVAATEKPRDENAAVTRSYVLQLEQGDREKLRDEVRTFIVDSLPDEQWNGRLPNGDPVVLAVLADRVVLRHKPSAQQKLETLLVESAVAAPAVSMAPVDGGLGGGGFGGGGGKGGRGGGGFFSVPPDRTE